jgi:tetratricopeptide (TPR) repeat protein
MAHALALHQSGDLAGAGSAYRKILDDQPHEAMALHYLGVIAHQTGRRDEALQWIEKSIAAAPEIADFHGNLGVVLRDMGRLNESAAALCQAIRLRPKYPEALNNLGDVMRQLGKLAEAECLLRQAIAIHPAAGALKNLGLVLIDGKCHADAAKVLRDAIKHAPRDAAAHKYLGIALRLDKQAAAAVVACRAAIAADDRDADAWFGLGQSLRDDGDMPAACEAYRQALKRSPNQPDVLIGLAASLNDMGELEAAIETGLRAVALRPASNEARHNLSLSLLGSGRLAAGWPMYESRVGCGGFMQSLLRLEQPQWDGRDAAGRTIFLRAEQGCGDTIHFARYIRMLAARGAKIILECQPELKSLLQDLPGTVRVVARGEEPGEFDCHLPLLSLPLHFQTTLENIPAAVPYLRADEGRVEIWRSRFAKVEGFKVGLVWAGNPDHRNDRNRSLPAELLSPLLAVEGVEFFSLQLPRPRETPAGMTDLSADLHDFSDTAAALSQLDLLICVDTAIAHLAGALGRPVWTLLPQAADWRWMRNAERTSWYPTMRLFRQTVRGDWGTVIDRVQHKLGELCRIARV